MIIKCEFQNCAFQVDDCKFKSVYTCRVTSASIKHPNTTIESFDGIHLSGKTDDDVQAVWFNETVVEYFPKGLSDIFNRLIVLIITKCGLKTISWEDLYGLENLQTLNVSENDIKLLPDSLFAHMQNLKLISFWKNKLEFVSSNLLKPMLGNGLILVDFRLNTSIDSMYDVEKSGNEGSLDDLMFFIDIMCKKPNVDAGKFLFEHDMLRRFEELWISGRLSDFVIKVGSKEFPVHRSILSVHSSVFAEIFENDEQAKEMNIEDISVSVVENFLRFLYTGELSEDVNPMELFVIAAKLDVPLLKSFGESLIMEVLDQSNAQKVLSLAHVYGSNQLKKSAFKEIKKMLADSDLPDGLMNDPKKIKEIIELKQKYDSIKTGCE